MKTEKIIVIGNGMIGQRFLEQLVSRLEGRATEVTAQVTVFCAEPRPTYDRVQLTSFFSGKSAADLNLVPAGFFERHGIALRLGDKALAIDRVRKIVRSARGHELPYDKLVLATGSYPFVPKVPGAEWPDCFVYRAIEDLEAIRAAAGRARVGTVIGGGLLGLEAAKALHDLGLETHVVEFAPRLMVVQLDDSGGRLLRRKIEALGVSVHASKHTKEIVKGNERRHRLLFADGRCCASVGVMSPPTSGCASLTSWTTRSSQVSSCSGSERPTPSRWRGARCLAACRTPDRRERVRCRWSRRSCCSTSRSGRSTH